MVMVSPIRTFLHSRFARWLTGMLGAGVLATTFYRFGTMPSFSGNPWLWTTIGLLLLLGVLVAYNGRRMWSPISNPPQRHETARPEIDGEGPADIRAQFVKTLQTLPNLPQLRGKEDPLYTLPWYLLIGESGSGKTIVLQNAGTFSPLTRFPSDAATHNYDWWISDSAIVLDTAGRYTSQIDMVHDREEWLLLLRLLRQHRPRCPMDGLIIAIAVDKIALGSPEQNQAEAAKLRERIEEVIQELGEDIPVYLLVTKCDLIEGFGEFFVQIPERVRKEVVGYIEELASHVQEEKLAKQSREVIGNRFTAGLQSIYDRLHLLRLSVLDNGVPEAVRSAVFCFPEEFKALQIPLSTFATTLLSGHVSYRTPLFRGIFFTSARQGGVRFSLLRRQLHLEDEALAFKEGNTPFFLYDLFVSILPRDRALSRPVKKTAS
jgi:type VI secretion system protein ImpL